MFARTLSALVTTLVAAATFAVASAMATDEPAPPSAPSSPGSAKSCVDSTRPVSRLSANWRTSFRNGVVRGIAIDQGCGAAGAGKVSRVSVAIERKVGKRCQHLLRNGRLSRATTCSHVWLPAKGKANWSLGLRHKLPLGRYIVSTRAVDAAGNVEKRSRR
jgi:hypothetical protein